MDNTKICFPCTDGDIRSPDKVLGEPGRQAFMWIEKINERQVQRLRIQAGFSWRDSIKPILPNNPDWCPMTHFGYLESGKMGIEMENGEKSIITAGETYFVPPGHIPIIEEDTVMIEFSQDNTYTNPDFINGSKKKNGFWRCLFC